MKYRRIWFVMLGIIAVGVLVTTCNRMMLNRRFARDTAIAQEFAGEEASTAAAMESLEDGGAAGDTMAVPGGGLTNGSAPAKSDATAMAGAAATTAAAAGDQGAGALTEEKTEVLSPLETTAATAFTESEALGPGMAYSEKSSTMLISDESRPNYRARLDELDLQIQKIRSTETEATTYSMKTAAENELKLWDSELNNIYNDILTYLNEEQTQELVTEEREWMRQRDAKAVEAAKKSAGGTLEGLEYTASLAESTRQRAYELASVYEQVAE